MAKDVKPVPDGYSAVIPYLIVSGAEKAIQFYQKALGARETSRRTGADGQVLHAELRIGDAVFMLSDQLQTPRSKSPEILGGTAVRLLLYVPDVDAAFQKAVAAGAKGEQEPRDMFWGDRYAKVLDPFGHRWDLCSRKENLPPEEIRRRQEELSRKSAGK